MARTSSRSARILAAATVGALSTALVSLPAVAASAATASSGWGAQSPKQAPSAPHTAAARRNARVASTGVKHHAALLKRSAEPAVVRGLVTPTHIYTVANGNDDGIGSLRAALAKAAVDKTFDKIVLPARTYTLSTDQLVVDDPAGVLIAGAGAATTKITQTGAFRVLEITDGTPLTMSGVTVTGGHATTSGEDGLGGGIEVADGFLKLTGSIVSANTADVRGGGIEVRGADNSPIGFGAADLQHVVIRGNHAANAAGLDDENQVLAQYLSVSGNVAAVDAGGIGLMWDDNAAPSLDGSHLDVWGNSAEYGGGLYSEGLTSLTSSTIGGGSTAAANTASSGGGGIYNYFGTDDLSGVTISHNTANGTGGGIYEEYSVDTISGGSITNNTGVSGGGIGQSEYSALTASGTHIDHNVATSEGGGLYSDYSTAVLTKGTLSSNTTEPTVTTPVTYTGDGGGAYLESSSDITLKGTTVANDQAEYGGGLYADESNGVHLDGATFKNNNNVNQSTAIEGGAMYVYEDDNVTVSDSVFTGNVSAYGGAMYFDEEEDPVTIDGSTFTGNKALGTSAEGGAIYDASEAPLAITDSVISSNVAGSTTTLGTSYGGGIYLFETPTRLDSVAIVGNHADFGGGVAADEDTLVRVTGSTIGSNTADAAGAGVVGLTDSTVALRNSAVTRNVLSGNGSGGLFGAGVAITSSSSLDAVNATIAGNRVGSNATDSYGAGVEVEGNSAATLRNVTVATNVAPSGHPGSAIAYGDTGQVQLAGTIVSGSGSAACSATHSANTGRLTSDGYNVASDATCGVNSVGDRHSVALQLGTLGKHGGPTATVPLKAGSPAVNNDAGCPLPATDQRGVPRAAGSCDSGAYERTPGHVSGIKPHKGKAGIKVQITGSGFYFVQKVLFGSHRAHILSKSAHKVVVRAPKGPKGLKKHARKVPVRVLTPDGASGVGHFTYVKLHHHKKH